MLTIKQISALLSLLAETPEGGLPEAIDVLSMVIHCTDPKDEQYKTELQAYSLEFVGELDWGLIDFGNENLLHDLERVVEFSLDGNAPCDAATKALNRLIQQERKENRIFPRRLGKVLSPFFKKCPTETLDAVYTKDKDNDLLHMLTIQLNRHCDTAIGVVPEESLLEWCKVSPEDRYVFAAKACKLFERSNSSEGSDEATIGISSTAINLLSQASDKKKILETLVSRFSPSCWSGSRAAIMRQRLEHLDKLNPAGDIEISSLIEETKARFSKAIKSEEQLEQDRERLETASFE